MVTRQIALTAVDDLAKRAAEDAKAFQMDEGAFRAFYDRTARSVWAYLSRVTGDEAAADDLLQDAYYRFLCSRVVFENEAHRRNYLFRIATNLVHDSRRRRATEPPLVRVEAHTGASCGQDEAAIREQGADVRRALAKMKPRDREILWLAYAEGSSHREISGVLGISARSVRVLLHRARRRLLRVLDPRSGGQAERTDEGGRKGR